MSVIRITKIFSFEMAHALWNYDGDCKNIHGHSYKLYVTITGIPVNDCTDPKYGMVLDFIDISKIVKSTIISKFDHALIISQEAASEHTPLINQLSDRLIITSFQPTAENILIHFADILKRSIPDNVKLHSLKLQETETSFAEWVADDN